MANRYYRRGRFKKAKPTAQNARVVGEVAKPTPKAPPVKTEESEDVEEVVELSAEDLQEVTDDEDMFSEEDLTSMSWNDLRALARKMDLKGRTKATLVEKILDKQSS